MPCEVEQFLDRGGQGEVYRADLGGKSVALKWYFPAQATQQRSNLETLIKKGAPSNKFLWPMELTLEEGVEGFGYIMPLREPRYKSIVDLMKRRIEPTFRALATAGLNLSQSFLELHAKGLCFLSISFGNVFFDPDTGEVLISFNEDVAEDDEIKRNVLGTPRFMAPEVVRGDALPSKQTDLFSLAVILFYMFVMHHPLEGKKESSMHVLDLPNMNKLYGTEPVFIFDPNDDSNRPVPGYHDNALTFWPIYPQFLRDLFTKAFTDGIRDPQNGRVSVSEWQAAMVRLRDSIIYCAHCGMENFYDADALKASGGKPGDCWKCQKEKSRKGDLNMNRCPFEFHIIWILDCSFGMDVGWKIQAMNTVIRESIPHFAAFADEEPNSETLMSAVTYGTGARWHLKPTPIHSLRWSDAVAFGASNAGAAFQLVESMLWRWRHRDAKCYPPPMIVWVASSTPMDEWEEPLNILVALSDCFDCSRVAIPVGKDAPLDILQEFIGNPELLPIPANSCPEALFKHIHLQSAEYTLEEHKEQRKRAESRLSWVLKSASSPSSQTEDEDTSTPTPHLPIPIAPDTSSADDVW
jgi:serine/threonine protein kinase/uncharacterized protein YegL